MPGFLEELAASIGAAEPVRSPLQIDPAAGGFHATGPAVAPVAPASGFTASKVPFPKFDEQFIGTGVGHNYNGYGFYLTGSKGYATAVRDQYHKGGVIQEAKIAPGKMFDLDAKTINPDIRNKIEQFTGKPVTPGGSRAPARFATSRDALYALENQPVGAYRALFQDPTISTSQQGASRFLSAAGYKGNTYSDSYGQHYVIYNSKDLEVIDLEK